jgi:hypothetical protein
MALAGGLAAAAAGAAVWLGRKTGGLRSSA